MKDRASVRSSSSDAHHPVELARRLVGAGEEDAAHVQEDDDHHGVGGPAVHVAQEHAERHHELQVLHAAVGRGRVRHVVEHQREAGHRQDDEQEEADEAEPERVGGAQHVHAGRGPGGRGGTRLEIIAAARSLSVRGQPTRKTDRRPRRRRLDRASRHVSLQPEVGTDRPAGVHDQLAARRQDQGEAGQRPGRGPLAHAPVLVEGAAVARAGEALPRLAGSRCSRGGCRRTRSRRSPRGC